MLGKKNTLSRISKRKMRTSAISVLMSLVLISTPVYPDEMEMEEYVDYDDGSYDDYEGYYMPRIDITCRKEKGNVKYQFGWQEGKNKKWQYSSIDKSRGFMVFNVPKNIIVSVKVRTRCAQTAAR